MRNPQADPCLTVTTTAAQVFDAPVVVPATGRVCADDAAVQAAWAATSERPVWPLQSVAEPAPDHRPVIRDPYARKDIRLPG